MVLHLGAAKRNRPRSRRRATYQLSETPDDRDGATGHLEPGIGADLVAVAGQLGEALSGLVDRHRSVVDLTADRPLEHGRVDEGGLGMGVAWGRIRRAHP